MKETIARRFEEADLAADRFVSVHDGEKKCTDHDTRWSDPREVRGESYGIYADPDDAVVILDVDYHREGGEELDPVALAALEDLPSTLKAKSPHVPEDGRGGHWFLKLSGDETPGEFLKRTFGEYNPEPTWGEVRTKNQYVVGAGSQLDGCDKEWCDGCSTAEGGVYSLKDDQEIATVDPDTLADVLEADEELTREGGGADGDVTADYSSGERDGSGDGEYDEWMSEADVQEALSYLDPDCGRVDWVEVAYALVDFFGERAPARDMFKEWSKGELNDDHVGDKWDDDAPRLADHAIDEAKLEAGQNDVTLGTVIKRARENGWEDPKYSGRDEQRDDRDGEDAIAVPAVFDVVDGGYAKWKDSRDDDASGWYDQITNFQIEVLSRLTHDDERREFLLRIHPADGEPYDLAVEPTSFNELRRFRRDVLEGWSVTFDGGQQELNDLKRFVAGQEAPDRRGTKQIGLHGAEFVTPEGSLTADGWTDEPAVVYTDESSQLNPLWRLSPDDDPDDVDRDAVARMLTLLPQTRDPERFLPVLGWFYAAPLRPLIEQWEGEFNLLNVLGDTGAGKTATLEALWQMFGMEGELLTAETTPFTMLTALSSTNGLPVVFDEYKPTDMSERRKDKLHRYLRTSTKGGVESKGNADRTTDSYHLHAPVCLAGEQPIQGPAEERRAIMTTFTRDGVVGDTPQSRAFARLTGGKAADEYHDGLPLTDHALAFYKWLLERDTDSLRELWRNSRERVVEILDDRDLDADVLDDMVVQGFQTVWFGCALYRMFATEMGVDTDAVAVTPGDVEEAIAYVAEEGGGADHVSHLDRFVGLLGRAAAADYVEPGEHFSVVESGVNDTEELRIRLSTAFDQVRRYARDHDVRGEDLLDSLNDYRARIRDNAEDPDGYVATTSQVTRLDDSTQARCVALEIARADAVVDEFEVGMFVDGATTDGEREDPDEGGVADLEPGHHSFAATVDAVLEPKPWLQGEGTLHDRSGRIDYVVRDGSGDVPALEEGERYRFDGARVTTDEDGVAIVEIRPGATDVQPATRATGLDHHDAGDEDGDGDINPPTGEVEGLQANVMDTLRENDGEASVGQLAATLANGETSPDEVESAVDRLKSKGRVTVDDNRVRIP